MRLRDRERHRVDHSGGSVGLLFWVSEREFLFQMEKRSYSLFVSPSRRGGTLVGRCGIT